MMNRMACRGGRIILIISILLFAVGAGWLAMSAKGISSSRIERLGRQARALAAIATSDGGTDADRTDAVERLQRLMGNVLAQNGLDQRQVVAILGQPTVGTVRSLELEYRFPLNVMSNQSILVWCTKTGIARTCVRVVRPIERIPEDMQGDWQMRCCEVRRKVEMIQSGVLPPFEIRKLTREIWSILLPAVQEYAIDYNQVEEMFGEPTDARVCFRESASKDVLDSFYVSYEYFLGMTSSGISFSFNAESDGLAHSLGILSSTL